MTDAGISRRALLVGAGTWAAIGGHAWWRRRRAAPEGVRIVSWNLRNYSGLEHATSRHAPGHDGRRLRAHLQRLAADVFCFQEVLDPGALAQLLPDYTLEHSSFGGAHGQHLVVARRPHVRAESAAHTDPRVALGPGLRPTLVQSLRWGEQRCTVVVVHLKAGRNGFTTRQQQLAQLVQQLRALPRPRIVLGDFNTTGPPGGTPDQEIASLCERLGTVDLHRATSALPCSAYWEGHFDRYKQASTLDHVFSDRAASDAPPLHVAPGTQCARHACRAFSSTHAYPDLDYERVSDHCPLLLDLPSTWQFRDPANPP